MPPHTHPESSISTAEGLNAGYQVGEGPAKVKVGFEEQNRAWPGPFQFPLQGLGTLRGAAIMEGEIRPRGMESPGNLGADAMGGAGDQGDLAGQV